VTLSVDVEALTVRFGDVTAVDDLTFRLAGGKIYGLLGRNGAGKSTLLSTIAAYRKPTSGAALVGGEDPFENPVIMPQVCFVRESLDIYESDRAAEALKLGKRWRPNWDADYADALVERFKVPLKRSVNKLSRGMKSALGVTIGLASRAPVTIFDEAYLGMDAPSRYAFYEELLADYMRHPRTIIMSTHLIEEVSSLFEEVLILDQGRLVVHEDTDALRSRGAAVVGPAEEVDRITADLNVLNEQQLGGTKSVTVYGTLPDGFERDAHAAGLDLGPVALQDLFVHLTSDGRANR
jgi:ABC-2 type transport system ATP-binding protein